MSIHMNIIIITIIIRGHFGSRPYADLGASDPSGERSELASVGLELPVCYPPLASAGMLTEEDLARLDSRISASLVDKLLALLDSRLGSLASALSARLERDIDARIAALAQQLESSLDTKIETALAARVPRGGPTSSAGSSDGRRRMDHSPTKKVRTAASEGGASGSLEDWNSANPCRVWVGPFPKPMLGLKLQAHSAALLGLVTNRDTSRVEFRGSNFALQYSLTFPSPLEAREFRELADTSPVPFVDPRGVSHLVRVRPDRTVEARRLRSAMGMLWKEVFAFFDLHKRPSSTCKLGTNMARGVLFYTDGEELWELFRVQRVGSSEDPSQEFSIEPHLEHLQAQGVDEANCRLFIDRALANVR